MAERYTSDYSSDKTGKRREKGEEEREEERERERERERDVDKFPPVEREGLGSFKLLSSFPPRVDFLTGLRPSLLSGESPSTILTLVYRRSGCSIEIIFATAFHLLLFLLLLFLLLLLFPLFFSLVCFATLAVSFVFNHSKYGLISF